MAQDSKSSWYILRFEENTNSRQQATDVLYRNDPKQAISAAVHDLENLLHRRFGRLGDLENGDFFKINKLFVMYGQGQELEITLAQLVTVIREMAQEDQTATAPGVTTKTPDLWGLGTNKVGISFEYLDAHDIGF